MRKNIFKTTVIAMAVLTAAFGMTACGKKNNTAKDTNTTAAQENVTVADKNNTNNAKKTSKVVFDYTDADGNTSKLEGNATVNDNGEATIEVIDSNGNKAVFTGKANTDNGKLSVSDIKVKDAGTLVKTDGTEVKVSEGAKIEDATESTEATKADVAAKDETKEDVIVADGGNSGTDSDASESTGNENTGDNGAGNDTGNVADTPSNELVETPDVPSEPEYVPDEPENGDDTGNDSGNEWTDDSDSGNDGGNEDSGSEDTGSSSGTNYIPCIVYGFNDDATEDWAITWDMLNPTSNKYIYYRIEGRRYDYFVFNENIDTAIKMYNTLNTDVEEQTKTYVKINTQFLPYLVY